MTWTTFDFEFEQVLTATEMDNLYANFAAMAAGDSGAPSIQPGAIQQSGTWDFGTGDILAASGTFTSVDGTLVLNRRNDTSIAAGNVIGGFGAQGNDTTGNAYLGMGRIEWLANGVHSAGDNPTKLIAYVVLDGTETEVEAFSYNATSDFALTGKMSIYDRAAGGGYTASDNLTVIGNSTAFIGIKADTTQNAAGYKFYNQNTLKWTIQKEGASHTFQIIPADLGSSAFTINQAGNIITVGDVTMGATKKLYLDGGSDTYIYESSANKISAYCGGTQALDMTASLTQIKAGDFSVTAGDATADSFFTRGNGLFNTGSAGASYISGDTTGATGANTRWFGASHGSQANDIEFRTATTVRMSWDNSAGYWYLNGNSFDSVGDITITTAGSVKSGMSKFWVNYNQVTTTAIQDSFNVTSVTDNGTGDCTITIATDFGDADWASSMSSPAFLTYVNAKAAGTIRVLTANLVPAVADVDDVSVIGHGNQ